MITKMSIGSSMYYATNRKFYTRFYGRYFLLLYHFNYQYEDLFENDTEALKSDKENKYSIIGELSDYFKINQKFEFVLWYPSFINHWRQSINPVLEKETNYNHDRNATGYEPLHIGDNSKYWGGLVYCCLNHSKGYEGSLLDGSTYHSNWYYSIAPFYSFGVNIFPAGNKSEKEAALWIRMPFFLSCRYNKSYHTNNILLLIFLISS